MNAKFSPSVVNELTKKSFSLTSLNVSTLKKKHPHSIFQMKAVVQKILIILILGTIMFTFEDATELHDTQQITYHGLSHLEGN